MAPGALDPAASWLHRESAPFPLSAALRRRLSLCVVNSGLHCPVQVSVIKRKPEGCGSAGPIVSISAPKPSPSSRVITRFLTSAAGPCGAAVSPKGIRIDPPASSRARRFADCMSAAKASTVEGSALFKPASFSFSFSFCFSASRASVSCALISFVRSKTFDPAPPLPACSSRTCALFDASRSASQR